ncbi:hypothetical protein WN944_004876 [Citrus x changshan-huyou]|uniref:Uncharacterized protein n=1 Tax=Citrus x changshan-huyou TaxID=2935761 RepID=A0AAP0QJ20_9ROSI
MPFSQAYWILDGRAQSIKGTPPPMVRELIGVSAERSLQTSKRRCPIDEHPGMAIC